MFGAISYYLTLTGLATVAIQMAFFIVAYTFQFDKVTDFSGTLNFAVLSWLVYLLSGSHYTRQTIMTICVTIWAQRLGFFLLVRVMKRGRDARFDGIREDFFKFLGFWTFQIIWVWTVSLPVTLTNAATVDVPLGPLDYLGFAMWLLGFVIEAVADHDKDKQFELRESSRHQPIFTLNTGLWRYSRHPNYFGEMILWLGLYLSSCSIYDANEFQYGYALGAASPLLTFFLLAFISGMPMAEASADKRYAESIDYKRYKMSTSPLVPFPPTIYSALPFIIRCIFFFEFPLYWKRFTH